MIGENCEENEGFSFAPPVFNALVEGVTFRFCSLMHFDSRNQNDGPTCLWKTSDEIYNRFNTIPQHWTNRQTETDRQTDRNVF